MADDPKLVEYFQRVTTELQRTRARVRELESTADDPVAVVGMGCRFGGGIDSPDRLWDVLAAGEDVITPFPTDRGWTEAEVYDPDPDTPGASYVREGGFLHDAAEFDAGFFGISPREALSMDPQQRVVLEVAWQALADTGVDPATLRGSRTGVFLGQSNYDYLSAVEEVPQQLVGQFNIGNAPSVLSGRLSYFFGFEGPSLTIDTACSSSLVSMHLAAQSLRNGECSLALAGGVTIMCSPLLFVEMSQQRGLAPDGRCKPFAAAADGAAWGEGAGVVVLEKLSDARRNGHTVLALLRGSAVNSDGTSSGLTAPNGPSQQQVITDALSAAGLSPADVDVVEAHGTGTALGDPIEAQALLATYGRHHTAERPVLVGAAKANLGHTQAAAGVAGVLKVLLSMRHGVLPKTLNFDAPNPRVTWEPGLALLTESTPWPATGRPRRAGVSGFGISGTNAHVVLEQVPADEPAEAAGTPLPTLPFVLSSRTPDSLPDQAKALLEHLERHEPAPLDLAHSLATTRGHLTSRGVVFASTVEQVRDALRALSTHRGSRAVIAGDVVRGGTAFVYPGLGEHFRAAGLYAESAEFRAQIAECEKALMPFVPYSLADAVREGADSPDVARVVHVAVQIALTELWRSTGLVPDAVAGQAEGEIAAAWAAGALSLTDALRVAAVHGRLTASLDAVPAAVATIPISEEEARQVVAEWGGRVEVSSVDSPFAVTVSGDEDAVVAVTESCEARGIRTVLRRVGAATHTTRVDDLRSAVVSDLAPLLPQRPTTPLVSGVTGTWVTDEALDATYWYEVLRAPVRWVDATRTLLKGDHRVLVEVSVDPSLVNPIAETAHDEGVAAIVTTTLHVDGPGLVRFVRAVGEAHIAGSTIDWPVVFAGSGARRVPLPGYAFQHERYWLERRWKRPRMTGDDGLVPTAARRSPAARLWELPADEREAELVEIVRSHVAVVLDHTGAEAVPLEKTFRDMGLESLSAMQLRMRMRAATGVELDLGDVLNYPTVRDLAERAVEKLAEMAENGSLDAPLPEPAPSPGESTRTDDSVAAVYIGAIENGRMDAAVRLARAVSATRDTFAAGDPGDLAELVKVGDGHDGPTMIGLTPPIFPNLDLPYTYLHNALTPASEVWSLWAPGFTDGVPLPRDRTALFEMMAKPMRRFAGERFVVVGYSSGGYLAHGLVAHLEETGMTVPALVLIDTFLPEPEGTHDDDGGQNEFMQEQIRRRDLMAVSLDREGRTATTTGQIGAMGGYNLMFSTWRPEPVKTPILHLKAGEAVAGVTVGPDDRHFPNALVNHWETVPGDHFTMLSRHADVISERVHAWLPTVLG